MATGELYPTDLQKGIRVEIHHFLMQSELIFYVLLLLPLFLIMFLLDSGIKSIVN